MLHFIALRNQMKFIETIKKTTGAMRLMSMSLHSRLRNQKTILEEYTAEINRIIQELKEQADGLRSPVDETTITTPQQQADPIIVIVGSQKGLCGIFNENVFMLLEESEQPPTSPIITIGKRASDYMRQTNHPVFHSFDQLNIANFTAIASKLTSLLLSTNRSTVKLISNYSRSFFVQKSRIITLSIPKPYDAEHPTTQFLNYVEVLQLKVQLLHILYESLLSEQAARFISMDTATRNAEDVLEQTRINYNKTRQAAVTKELTELSTSMSHGAD